MINRQKNREETQESMCGKLEFLRTNRSSKQIDLCNKTNYQVLYSLEDRIQVASYLKLTIAPHIKLLSKYQPESQKIFIQVFICSYTVCQSYHISVIIYNYTLHTLNLTPTSLGPRIPAALRYSIYSFLFYQDWIYQY